MRGCNKSCKKKQIKTISCYSGTNSRHRWNVVWPVSIATFEFSLLITVFEVRSWKRLLKKETRKVVKRRPVLKTVEKVFVFRNVLLVKKIALDFQPNLFSCMHEFCSFIHLFIGAKSKPSHDRINNYFVFLNAIVFRDVLEKY